MTVQTDLHDALTLLEHDVAQHVAAFADARRSVLDTAFIEAATQRVIGLTQTLVASYGSLDTPAPAAAPESAVASQVTVPAATGVAAQSALGPSVAESIAAAIASAAANAPH